jgi:peptide/nickel transport system permease protein
MYVIGRIVTAVITLFVSSVVIFSALYLAPGSPLDFLFGGAQVTPGQRNELAAYYGLNRPFVERYGVWLGHVLSGDFGTSILYHQKVSTLIASRADTTILLVAYALVLTVLLGVVWGGIGAVRRGKTDTAVIVSTSIGFATPPFVAAILLIAVFAVQLGWFPVQGVGGSFGDQLWHLTLPAISLSIALAAMVARITRTAFREELSSDHVVTARSRGFTSQHIVRRHVARNSLIPIVTITGLITAYLITGTIVIEQVFALNGLGSMLIEAVSTHDFPVAQAISLLVVAAFTIINIIVDFLYLVLDPRLRHAVSQAAR